MKKTILVTLAIASMMSCSNEEVIDIQAKQAITFDNAFVEKAPGTRAAYDGSYDGSYTTNSLTQFQVYATVTNTNGVSGRVFTGDVVSYNETSDEWTYKCPTQYWVPGNTYNFWAITDGNVKGATSVVTESYVPTEIHVLDASKQNDVLLATRTYEDYQTDHGTTVAFTLHHLLAKAKFTVKNTIKTNSGYSYKVRNLTIVDVEQNGVYDIAKETWGAAETPATYDLSFGNAVTTGTEAGAEADYIEFDGRKESNYERLLIPSNKQLNITFDCEIYKENANEEYILISSEKRTITTTNKVNLEAGKAYNLIISLANPGEEIKFTVNEVSGWINNNPGVEIK